MNENIYPLTFTPVFRDYIWGGRNLETRFGRALPPGIVAESWEISGHASSSTPVDHGPLAGRTLLEITRQLGLELVGIRSWAMLERGKFPLLVKLLDANQPLSVQVHPPDDYAIEHENGDLGKTEMWYVLHAEKDAYIIYGLKPDVTPESFRQAIETNTVEKTLHKLPVKPGDVIFIPTGTVHALMEGLVMTEIQQNSDTTYRVYDWGRGGAEGKPRPLHIDKALAVTNFDMVEPGPTIPQLLEETHEARRELLVSCPYFHTEKFTFKQAGASFAGQGDGRTFEIWGILTGQGRINWTGHPVELSAIRFVLLPATLGDFEIEVTEPAVFLRVFMPE
ncbi:MAG: class I mannose-6-phosphate isomerase [Anaerolineae bacterium]|nr:class I mannose-6-phosphate isomerase [Anaerolineae bacterium]